MDLLNKRKVKSIVKNRSRRISPLQNPQGQFAPIKFPPGQFPPVNSSWLIPNPNRTRTLQGKINLGGIVDQGGLTRGKFDRGEFCRGEFSAPREELRQKLKNLR